MGVKLEVSGDFHGLRAEGSKPFGVFGGLRRNRAQTS